jgi:integrase
VVGGCSCAPRIRKTFAAVCSRRVVAAGHTAANGAGTRGEGGGCNPPTWGGSAAPGLDDLVSTKSLMQRAFSAPNGVHECEGLGISWFLKCDGLDHRIIRSRKVNETETPAGGMHHFPGASNRNPTLRELADVYMANFPGRDATRPYSVSFWVRELGDRRILDIDADCIAEVLDRMIATPVHKYAGRDPATGKPVLRTHPRKRAPATINRLKSVISSMLAYAQRRRLMPKGWQNPCKEIPCKRVSNARTRFLSADERERLLRVARLSTWNKLYLLVLMALTTGARRGELLGLQYQDLDLDAGTAHLRQTKNGYERVLPLVPGVVAEIKRFGKGKPDKLLFASVRRPDQPMEIGKLFHIALCDAGIGNFRFHDLRHSCASYLAQ